MDTMNNFGFIYPAFARMLSSLCLAAAQSGWPVGMIGANSGRRTEAQNFCIHKEEVWTNHYMGIAADLWPLESKQWPPHNWSKFFDSWPHWADLRALSYRYGFEVPDPFYFGSDRDHYEHFFGCGQMVLENIWKGTAGDADAKTAQVWAYLDQHAQLPDIKPQEAIA